MGAGRSCLLFHDLCCFVLGDAHVSIGEYVMLNPKKPNQPLHIAKVQSMFHQDLQGPTFHAQLFCRGADTVLGQTSDPREIFVADVCGNFPLGSIVRKAFVEFRQISRDWFNNGGLDVLPPQLEDDGQTFFYNKRYDSVHGRFEYATVGDLDANAPCHVCDSCR